MAKNRKIHEAMKDTEDKDIKDAKNSNGIVLEQEQVIPDETDTIADKDEYKTTGKKNNDEKWFIFNRKYMMIFLYSLVFVLVGACVIKAVMGGTATVAYIKKLFSLVSPFIWGAFIAFLVNPLVRFFYNKVFGRIKGLKKRETVNMVISILLSYILAIGLIVIAVIYLVPRIGSSITDLFNRVPAWIEQATAWLMEFEKNNPQFDFQRINDVINDSLPQLMDFSKNIVTNLIPLIYSTSVSLVNVVVNTLVALIVSVYIIVDKHILTNNFKKLLYALVSEKTGDFIMETLRECYKIFSQFVYGKAIDSTIIGIICFVLMTIFGFPFALLISLIVGVTNMIPYFGPFIGAIPGVIFIFMVNPIQSLLFIVLILVIQQFDGLYLGPRILGETVGLRPLWIIFAITVGGSVAGVVGMFLGVPVVAVIAYLMNMLIEHLIKKKGVDIKKKIG